MRVAAFSTTHLAFVATEFPVVSWNKAAVANFMFLQDPPLVLDVGVFEHHGCDGEAFRLLESFGENEAFACWSLRTLGKSKGVWRLRIESRYSLSPTGFALEDLGVWLC